MKNRTLNRPMFRRGGKVDSRGTGITSGLMPRKNFEEGGKAEQTTQPEGLGFMQSPLKKYLIDPIGYAAKTAYSPLGNKMADIYNYSALALGAEPSANYFSPLYGGQTYAQEKSLDKEDKSKTIVERIGETLGGTTTDVPEAIINENTEEPVVDVEGTPEQKPEEEPNINLGKITDEIDFDDIEADIERKGEFYERLLKRDKKGQIFDALTAAAPKLLEEDYGGAIEKAGEKLKDDTKREATLLAIQESITNQNKETDDKKINSVAKTLFNSGEYGNMKEAKAAATKIVYRVTQDKPNKYDDSQNILNQIASINDSGNTHERDNKESYAFSRVKYANNPELFTLAQYTKKDPTKADSPYENNINTLINSPTNKGKIIIDPEKNTYISVNKKGQIKEFSNSVEAEAHLKT